MIERKSQYDLRTETINLKSPAKLCLKILSYGQREINEETTVLEIERQLQENGIISGELERSNEISKLPQPKYGNPETIIYVKRLISNDMVVCQKATEFRIKDIEEYKDFQKKCSSYKEDSNAKVLTVNCLTSANKEDHFSVVLIEKCLF